VRWKVEHDIPSSRSFERSASALGTETGVRLGGGTEKTLEESPGYRF
jgi:hypothetical protein